MNPTPVSHFNSTLPKLAATLGLCAAGLAFASGCETAFERIDRRTTELLAQSTATLGADAIVPRISMPSRFALDGRDHDLYRQDVPTVNPSADELTFTPINESDNADAVMRRLEGYSELSPDAVLLDLRGALSYAIRHSREYRFAEEEYVLAGLRLLIERHRWGPRFFDDLSATIDADGDNATFDSALRLVNEFGVTQRLPYGGEISARALARATEDLHQRVAGENVQTAELIFSADIPLLRGAGQVAREDRIQAERNLVYAARDFERFRREFLFEIAQDFLDLVVQTQVIKNAESQVQMREAAEKRTQALVAAGREPPFGAAQAVGDTLEARDSLNQQRERFRLAVDRFRVRLGMPQDEPVIIETSMFDIRPPQADLNAAVRAALSYRLDLQTRRDELDDARRAVQNARNDLLPDLDLSGSVSIPTDDERARAGLDFETGDSSFIASVTFGLPLDREIERLDVRRAQISLERATREFERFQDTVAVEARASVRNVDRARFSIVLQDRNRVIAQRRVEVIEAAPDRATALERSNAIEGLNRARDAYDRAVRDLQVGILRYLLDTGRLRVQSDGSIRLLYGRTQGEDDDPDNAPDPGGEPAG